MLDIIDVDLCIFIYETFDEQNAIKGEHILGAQLFTKFWICHGSWNHIVFLTNNPYLGLSAYMMNK